ncbi:MAG TPA: hypothetical protein VLL05_20980 [Terriglobales bacterium]|nr:hypothetical protein [Terriglobales bacterium]
MQFHALLAEFSFVVAIIATGLIPAAYFGDKNMVWTKRLIIIAAIAAATFFVELLRLFF